MKVALDSLKDILLCNCCGSVGFSSKRLGLQFVSVGFSSKRLGLQFVLIYFVVLIGTSQALQFQTAFLLMHSIVHAIVDDTFSFLTQSCITNTWDLGSLQNMENEANLLLPLGIQKLKVFPASSHPDPPDQAR